MRSLLPCLAVLFALCLTKSASASHWLVYSSTAVLEAGLLSQLLISRVLDQQTVSHWDSASWRLRWPSGAAGLRDVDYEHEETESRERLRKRSNIGKDALQRWQGCRLEDDGSVALFGHYSFNGQDFLSFEVDNMTWRASSLEAEGTQRDWNQNKIKNQYTRFFLETDCMETLKRFLQYREKHKNHTKSLLRCLSIPSIWETHRAVLCPVWSLASVLES